jgi:hypothetical protein
MTRRGSWESVCQTAASSMIDAEYRHNFRAYWASPPGVIWMEIRLAVSDGIVDRAVRSSDLTSVPVSATPALESLVDEIIEARFGDDTKFSSAFATRFAAIDHLQTVSFYSTCALQHAQYILPRGQV